MKNILLIISGGIAAYKSLELIRLFKKDALNVRCILTKGGEQFVTPLSVAALSENNVYTDIWSLKDETEMGHIRLSREADLIIIAPCSANMIAKMAGGLADDLASTTLLAADTPVMIVPAMNHKMWTHPATQKNITTLKERDICVIDPVEGEMACGEYGPGRMVEPQDILKHVQNFFLDRGLLKGVKAIVTSGPTYEPIDPVRFIGNRSSGKQGHAIAAALQNAGADVTLITGPVALPDPFNIKTVHVHTAEDMYKAVDKYMDNMDIAVCAAAPSDWRTKVSYNKKLKKDLERTPSFEMEENKDILQMISRSKSRPKLVIGFAAETENLIENAKAKLAKKGCDWILVNDVSEGKGFDHDHNQVTLITAKDVQEFPLQSKQQIAETLVRNIAKYLKNE